MISTWEGIWKCWLGRGAAEGELEGRAGEVGVVSRLEVAIIFLINGDSFVFMGGFFTRRKTACVQ